MPRHRRQLSPDQKAIMDRVKKVAYIPRACKEHRKNHQRCSLRCRLLSAHKKTEEIDGNIADHELDNEVTSFFKKCKKEWNGIEKSINNTELEEEEEEVVEDVEEEKAVEEEDLLGATLLLQIYYGEF
jgi:hypothetical protein